MTVKYERTDTFSFKEKRTKLSTYEPFRPTVREALRAGLQQKHVPATKMKQTETKIHAARNGKTIS